MISDYQFYDDNPYGFVAGTTTTDAAPGSLTKFGARWYLADQGSWTQQDTLDVPLDPSNADRYAYAGDDPINALDPTGYKSAACIAASSVVAGTGVFAAGLGIYAAYSSPVDLVPGVNAVNVSVIVLAGVIDGAVAAIAGVATLLYC